MAGREYQLLKRYLETRLCVREAGSAGDPLEGLMAWHLVALAVRCYEIGHFDLGFEPLEIPAESLRSHEIKPRESILCELLLLHLREIYGARPASGDTIRRVAGDPSACLALRSDERLVTLWYLVGDVAFPTRRHHELGDSFLEDGQGYAGILYEQPPLVWRVGSREIVIPGLAWRCIRAERPGWYDLVAAAERDLEDLLAPLGCVPQVLAGLEAFLYQRDRGEIPAETEGAVVLAHVVSRLNLLALEIGVQGADACEAIDAIAAINEQLMDRLAEAAARAGFTVYTAGGNTDREDLATVGIPVPIPSVARDHVRVCVVPDDSLEGSCQAFEPHRFSDPLLLSPEGVPLDRPPETPHWRYLWRPPVEPGARRDPRLSRLLATGLRVLRERILGAPDESVTEGAAGDHGESARPRDEGQTKLARLVGALWKVFSPAQRDILLEQLPGLFGLSVEWPGETRWSDALCRDYTVTFAENFSFESDPIYEILDVRRPKIFRTGSSGRLVSGSVVIAPGRLPFFAQPPFLETTEAHPATLAELAGAIVDQKGGSFRLAAELFRWTFRWDPKTRGLVPPEDLVERVGSAEQNRSSYREDHIARLQVRLVELIKALVEGDEAALLAAGDNQGYLPVFEHWGRIASPAQQAALLGALIQAFDRFPLVSAETFRSMRHRFVWKEWLARALPGCSVVAFERDVVDLPEFCRLWLQDRVNIGEDGWQPGFPEESRLILEVFNPASGIYLAGEQDAAEEPGATGSDNVVYPIRDFPLQARGRLPDHPAWQAFPENPDFSRDFLTQALRCLRQEQIGSPGDLVERMMSFGSYAPRRAVGLVGSAVREHFALRRAAILEGRKPTPNTKVRELIDLFAIDTIVHQDQIGAEPPAGLELDAVYRWGEGAGDYGRILDIAHPGWPPGRENPCGAAPQSEESRPCLVLSAGRRPTELVDLMELCEPDREMSPSLVEQFGRSPETARARWIGTVFERLPAWLAASSGPDVWDALRAFERWGGERAEVFPPLRALMPEGWSSPTEGERELVRLCAAVRLEIDPSVCPRGSGLRASLGRGAFLVPIGEASSTAELVLRLAVPDVSWYRGLKRCFEPDRGVLPAGVRDHLDALLFATADGAGRVPDEAVLCAWPALLDDMESLVYLQPLLDELGLCVFPCRLESQALSDADRMLLAMLPFLGARNGEPKPVARLFEGADRWDARRPLDVGAGVSLVVDPEPGAARWGATISVAAPGIYRSRELLRRLGQERPDPCGCDQFWFQVPREVRLGIPVGDDAFLNGMPGLVKDLDDLGAARRRAVRHLGWVRLQVFADAVGLGDGRLNARAPFTKVYNSIESRRGGRRREFEDHPVKMFLLLWKSFWRLRDRENGSLLPLGKTPYNILKGIIEWLPLDDCETMIHNFYSYAEALSRAFPLAVSPERASLFPLLFETRRDSEWIDVINNRQEEVVDLISPTAPERTCLFTAFPQPRGSKRRPILVHVRIRKE